MKGSEFKVDCGLGKSAAGEEKIDNNNSFKISGY